MDNPEEILAESDVYAMIERLNKMEAHITQYIPETLIYKENGEPNVHTRWGAIMYHLQYMRATFRSFL